MTQNSVLFRTLGLSLDKRPGSGASLWRSFRPQLKSLAAVIASAGLLAAQALGANNAHDTEMTDEHNKMLNLVPTNSSTYPVSHTFNVTSGNWNSAGNWSPASVPGANARVVIPSGRTVTYDKNDATTRVKTIRVDGTFKFKTDSDTALNVDTVVVMPDATVRDGHEFGADRGVGEGADDLCQEWRHRRRLGSRSAEPRSVVSRDNADLWRDKDNLSPNHRSLGRGSNEPNARLYSDQLESRRQDYRHRDETVSIQCLYRSSASVYQ
jgi:hypothetical protein